MDRKTKGELEMTARAGEGDRPVFCHVLEVTNRHTMKLRSLGHSTYLKAWLVYVVVHRRNSTLAITHLLQDLLFHLGQSCSTGSQQAACSSQRVELQPPGSCQAIAFPIILTTAAAEGSLPLPGVGRIVQSAVLMKPSVQQGTTQPGT